MSGELKILVIDDDEANRESARVTLAGHSLTIVDNFVDGMSLITEGFSRSRVRETLDEMGFTNHDERQMTSDQRQAYDRARKLAEAMVERLTFDVVMTDLMLPVDLSGLTMAQGIKDRDLAPYGFALALRAAREGVPFVAMLSRGNHHADPICHSLDFIGSPSYQGPGYPAEYTINGSKVVFTHAPMDGSSGKNWGLVLKDFFTK